MFDILNLDAEQDLIYSGVIFLLYLLIIHKFKNTI